MTKKTKFTVPVAILEMRDTVLDGLQATYNELTRPSDPPATVYHFTDVEGLVEILKKRSLRGTLASALSDTSEMKILVQQAQGYVDRRLAHQPTMFMDCVKLFFNKDNFDAPGKIELLPCVISFCSDVDLSVHWTHYGRSGVGAALGFSTQGLAVGQAFLRRVLYTEVEQQKLVEALLNRAGREVGAAIEKLDVEEHKKKAVIIGAHMTVAFLKMTACVSKAKGFEYEREWRMQINLKSEGPSERLPKGYKVKNDYRTVHGRVCPYVEVTYPREGFPLESITLGHASPISVEEDALHLLLADSMGREAARRVKISRSEIAIRP